MEKMERLCALKFYHPNDEAGEHFFATAEAAKSFAAYGSDEEFEWLYSRAKSMADHSAEFCIEQYGELDDDWDSVD